MSPSRVAPNPKFPAMNDHNDVSEPLEAVHTDELGGGPILDQESFGALQELAGDDDPDLISELIGLFIEDASDRMAQIESALGAEDVQSIGAAAHALKSSSANIGALAFSKACAALEMKVRRPDQAAEQDLSSLVHRAVTMYGEVRTALGVLLASD